MKATGPPLARVLVLLALVALVPAAGCTGDSGGDDPSPTGGTPEPTTPAPTGPLQPGLYRYANAGLVATLDLGSGTLTIENATGRTLPPPGLYVLDARDGTRVDGTVESPAEIPAGQTAEFAVSFEGVDQSDIGLVILLLGRDNYGAFVPG